MNRTKIKRWGIPAAAILLILVGVKYSGITAPSAGKQVVTPSAVAVKTAEVKDMVKTPRLLLTGSIEGETSVMISPKIAGRIAEVLVQDGQQLSAGQPMVMLESVELSNTVRMAADSVSRAEANYENIQADVSRYQTLFRQNAISRQQLDSAETRLKVAATDLSSAVASLSSARQQYAYASVLAPVAGVVANKSAVIGQVVAAGQQLMTLENIDQVYAVVNIEQKDMGLLQIGMKAAISVDAYPGRLFSGMVQVINPAAAASSRMFRTKLLLANSDFSLKPGMFVKAAIVTGGEVRVRAVPQSAVFQKQGLSYVYALENGKAKRYPVETGEILESFIEIKSGLPAAGIPVISSNVANIKDGDMVTPAN